MNTQETYNGWTNYATWRISLEVLDGVTPEEITGEMREITAEEVGAYAEEIIFADAKGLLVMAYATAFINDVNYHEIAKSINEDYKDQIFA